MSWTVISYPKKWKGWEWERQQTNLDQFEEKEGDEKPEEWRKDKDGRRDNRDD